jgi:pentatricopeptide repeat protein
MKVVVLGESRRPLRRRAMLFLLVGLLRFLLPVSSFVRCGTGRRLDACSSLAATTKSDDSTRGEFRRYKSVRNNSKQKEESPRRHKQLRSTRDQRANGRNKEHQKNLGAIIFNKWLTQFLRENNGSPDEAEAMLLEKVKVGVAGEDYDTLSFNLVLNAWARQRSKESARRADRLLQVLLQIPQIRVDGYSYSAVLNALAKSNGKRKAALRAEELLYQMEHSIKVTTDFCYNAVMDCWSVSGCEDAGRRAQRWLTRLEERGPSPSRISYNSCIKAWARSKDGAPQAHNLLTKMKSLGEELSPDKISYSTCIDAWCRCTSNLTVAAEKAEALLQQMENGADNDDVRPDVVAYTSVLYGFAQAGVDSQRALALVDRMQRYAKEEPNTTFLNTLIHFFAKSRRIEQAEALLGSMKNSKMADRITYTSLISAHANIGNATRALALLQELEGLYEDSKNERYLPTTKTFASVLYAISRSKGFPYAIDEAERLLNRLFELYDATDNVEVVPNTVVYSQVFLILSTSRNPSAPARALRLMEQMKEEQLRGNRSVNPDAATYAYLINTLTKARVPNAAERATKLLQEVERGYEAGDDDLKPTKLLYSAVLQAYAKSATQEGAEKAEELLQRTKDLYKVGKMYAKPTALYYNAVMDAHARSHRGRQAALRAEALLLELETRCRAGDSELAPTTRSYNAAILAWKNSNSTDAPQRAEALLKRTNERYGAGDETCRPDRVTINSIISVWANSCQEAAPERAEAFLRFMEKLYYEAGDESLKPDSYSFNSVIAAYSSSSSPQAAHRAEALYETMKRLHEAGDRDLKPDIITLTSLRHAWRRSHDGEAEEKLKNLGLLISQERRRRRKTNAS